MKMLRYFNLTVAFLLVASSLLAAQPTAAQTEPAQEEQPGVFIPGEVVVGFADGLTAKAYATRASALAGSVGAQVVGQYANLALFSFGDDADVEALAAQLSKADGVKFAEPNYVFSVPEGPMAPNRPAAVTEVTRRAGDTSFTVPVDALKSLQTVRNGVRIATYPNDPELWRNWGWWWIGADVLIGNTTPSRNVCVLDSGVDYTHPDLAGKVIRGYDFINNDADPMDDNGHGTHVAGIIAAVTNNKRGIAGISPNNRVIAVKVLNAQGWGSSFHVAVGIYYCANRLDVSILNLSLGSYSHSEAVYEAVGYAVGSKNKLVVAAAGNGNTSAPFYPAAYSLNFRDVVLAVGAEDRMSSCRASYSNYGNWVNVVAPGTDIFSTLPWKTPFYLNFYYAYGPGYDHMSGTSMAAPFVAAAAARRWGYTPLATNAAEVGSAVRTVSPFTVPTNGCTYDWPSSMSGVREVNVAALLGRGAASSLTYNATTGLPLTGATFQVYQNSTSLTSPGVLRGSGVVSYIWSGYAEALNLPVGSNYSGWTNFPGTTLGPQWTFWHRGSQAIIGGLWSWFGRAYVPNRNANFAVVGGWLGEWEDLDLYLWLPKLPKAIEDGQPAPFIVGLLGNSYGYLEGDPTGSLGAFPFALYNREGGYSDWLPLESITILNRRWALSGTNYYVPANPALPFYTGDYYIGMTGYDDMVLYYAEPFNYVWKDGRIIGGAMNDMCLKHWWFPWKLSSGVSGPVTLTWWNYCGDIVPYVGGAAQAEPFTISSTGGGSYIIRK